MQKVNAATRLLGALVLFAALTWQSPAEAGSYLDNTLGDVKPADRIVPSTPKPVQLLFEFQTNDAPNGRAQAILKDRVTTDIKNSGLFSEVSDGPATGGAILSVVVDNVADVKKAEGKGVAVGLTLGIAGTTVADIYFCTITYLGGEANAPKIIEKAQHAIYTTVGLFTSTPANATKMKNQDDAVYTMLDQILAHPLNDLADDPRFNPDAPHRDSATPPATAAASPATVAPPATTSAGPPAPAPSSQTAPESHP